MELLSPAGDYKKCAYAFHYGADAVYMGSGYSLRKGAENNQDQIKKSIELANKLGKKVYLATNVFFHNKQVDGFKNYLKKIAKFNPHALIISDFAMIEYVAKNYPDIEVHVSTQASITNYETAKLVKNLGAKRIIPARELHLEEIQEIIQKAKIDVEVFCHGALCMAYSGRCMLSAYLTRSGKAFAKKDKNKRLRDANQGDCAHPCRWDYRLIEKMRNDEIITVAEENGFMRFFNSHDLCLIKRVNKLKKAGIKSIKIEGRIKSAYYVALTAMAYRECIDKGYSEKCYSMVDSVSHRPFTEGFIMGDESVEQPVIKGGYIRKTRFMGTVEREVFKHNYRIDVLNKILPRDTLEIIGPDMKNIVLKPGDFKLLNETGEEIEYAGRHTALILQTEAELSGMDILRKKIDPEN